MRRDQILQLGMEQYQLFLEHFEWSLLSDEAECIHQFRVSVKKLNALKLLVDGPSIDAFIQPVYKSGGKVRNLQVVLDLLTTFVAGVPEGFKQYLYNRLQEKRIKHDNIAVSIELLSEKQFFRMFKEYVEMHYKGNGGQLETVIRRLGRSAFELIQKNKAGEAWHEARHHFKGCSHLIQMASSVDEPLVFADGFNRYRDMEQRLGRWHDLFMLDKLKDKYLSVGEAHPDNIWRSFVDEKDDMIHRIEADISLMAEV
jgi:CHAD domain-containing protein